MDVEFDFASRRKRLLKQTSGTADGVLVSNLINVRYLSGFSGSNAFLLFDSNGCTLLTDGRYTDQAAQQCPDLPTLIRPIDASMTQLVSGTIADSPAKTVLIESDHLTRALHRDLEKSVRPKTLTDSSGIVEGLRCIKDEQEIALVRKSVEINEAACMATMDAFNSSWTEQQLAWHLEKEIRSRHGDGFSFDPIVAAGPSSALPHYHPGATSIADHGFFLLDWGSNYRGYASDLTRMVAVKNVPDEIREIHKVVAAAKAAAITAVKDGALLKDVDAAARNLIAEAGFGERFNHGLGHGFGLEVHETPFMSPAFEGQLAASMVITIEPGIYLPGIGGVRLEDDILVTENGCEVLNCLPDDFMLLDA